MYAFSHQWCTNYCECSIYSFSSSFLICFFIRVSASLNIRVGTHQAFAACELCPRVFRAYAIDRLAWPTWKVKKKRWLGARKLTLLWGASMVKVDIDILNCPTQSSCSDARQGPKVNLFCSDSGFWGVLGVSLTVFHRKGFFFLQRRCRITLQIDSEKKKWVS